MIMFRQAVLEELADVKALLWNHGPNEWNYLTEEGVDAEFSLIEHGTAVAMVAVDSDKDQIIGFAVFIDGTVSPDYLTKYHALNELCIKEAKAKQVQAVLIERHEENLVSAGMMRKAGFQIVDTFYDPEKRSTASRKTSILECRVG
jgi:hypothetical protein